ncbi:chemotaxis response regulator protein-glutamate methylesterase [Peptococcaceae bacterium]|nr:chemotaxis response regulator protein-glutamate methylesterase [Peptococcaceae bacterium]
MPVKVLVVDDSALIRQLITRTLGTERDIQVIGQAADGLEALLQIKRLRPQVVTMDVEMPKSDGIASLRRVMKECPVPVIMLSAHTTAGAKATMEALAAGAVDFVAKPSRAGQLTAMVADLTAKIRAVAGASISNMVPTMPKLRPTMVPMRRASGGKIAIVIIGSSTGGPAALQGIISQLPANLPVGMILVQHIPPGFSQSLAEHLNRRSAVEVIHGKAGDEVRPGRVIVAPAGCELHFNKIGNRVTLKTAKSGEPVPPATFRPSVDQVITAATTVYSNKILGVLLTGMGRDGAQGMLKIKNSGGITIAEDKSSCVVFGMPKAAIDLGAVSKVLPRTKIAQEIVQIV